MGGQAGNAKHIGILAGWGDYPVVVAQALRRQGYRTFCLGVMGHADGRLADICDDFRWIGLAKFGKAIRYLKRHGVTDAVMAGKIHKVELFRPWRWLRHLPDARAVRMFAPHFLTRRKDCKDDTLLLAIVDEFGREGIRFGPATDYVPELLVKQGQLTRRAPSPRQRKDIEFGWKIAKELGRLDIGQSVAVKDQAVIALEAVEGTDECIRRAGQLCRQGGFTVVKVAKPNQDMRFDVPTIGERTLQTMHEARAKVLAVEADRSILLHEPKFVELANRYRLIVVSLEDEYHALPNQAMSRDQHPTEDLHRPHHHLHARHDADTPKTPSPSRER